MRYQNLDVLIRERYASYNEFAKQIGSNATQVRKQLSRPFTQETIIRWANALAIDAKDINKYFFEL